MDRKPMRASLAQVVGYLLLEALIFLAILWPMWEVASHGYCLRSCGMSCSSAACSTQASS